MGTFIFEIIYLIFFSVMVIRFELFQKFRKGKGNWNFLLLVLLMPIQTRLNLFDNECFFGCEYNMNYLEEDHKLDHMLILPLFLSLPYLISDLTSGFVFPNIKFHLSYLYERAFYQNFYFIHLILLILSIILFYRFFKAIKKQRLNRVKTENITFQNVYGEFLKDNESKWILWLIPCFAIFVICITNTDWYNLNPIKGFLTYIFSFAILFLVLFKMFYETPTLTRAILMFLFLVLFLPNISLSPNCFQLTNCSNTYTEFRYPILKSNINVLFSPFYNYIFNPCHSTETNPGCRDNNLKTTETSTILFGLYFFIFICYTELYHLKAKLSLLNEPSEK